MSQQSILTKHLNKLQYWSINYGFVGTHIANTLFLKMLTTIKNPQANSVLEHLHQVFGNMLRTSKLDMADSANAESVRNFLNNTVWAVFSTYHTVLK